MPVKNVLHVPLDFLKVLFVKVTHHKGKFSFFKLSLVIAMITYIAYQPWSIVRTALTSAFTGYMLNNTTRDVLDTVTELEFS